MDGELPDKLGELIEKLDKLLNRLGELLEHTEKKSWTNPNTAFPSIYTERWPSVYGVPFGKRHG